jgi:hypothetical protein
MSKVVTPVKNPAAPWRIVETAIDLKCQPNYSFDVGDVDGDGRMEFASLGKTGDLLRVHNLDGQPLFERPLENTGNWGTATLCVADVNNDGRCEIIVPSGEKVIVFDAAGVTLAEAVAAGPQKDAFQLHIPLLGVARTRPGGGPSIIACGAGGTVRALDARLGTLWKADGFRRDFGHEIHFADIDNDGLDEIAFCTADNINGKPGPANTGELVVLDHAGSTLLRRRVEDYLLDTHFDDIAMADFMGDGTTQILVEKGLLLDLSGKVLWDLSDRMGHGQWIAHAAAPDGNGRVAFVSEEWGGDGLRSLLFTGRGKVVRNLQGFPWPPFSEPDLMRLPTRCHAVRRDAGPGPEIFFAQQAQAFENGHACMRTRGFQLSAFFMDLRGNMTCELPFDDTRIEGFFYNGETHSKVADVDGDGRAEIVFPKQDGRVMLFKQGTTQP